MIARATVVWSFAVLAGFLFAAPLFAQTERVAVAAPDSVLEQRANTGEHVAEFTVTNISETAERFGVQCTAGGKVSCLLVDPDELELEPGARAAVRVRYEVGEAGVGLLVLLASNPGGARGLATVLVRVGGEGVGR